MSTCLFFSLVTDNRDMQPQAVEADWLYLKMLLSKPKPRGDVPLQQFLRLSKNEQKSLKNGPGWIPAKFKSKKSRREDVEVEHCYTFVGDCDNKDGQPQITRETLKRTLNGYAHHAHTSYSHSPICDKWRFVVPLKRPVSREEYLHVFAYFNERLDGALDNAAKNSSHMYYLPSCPPDAVGLFECFNDDGAFFDPDTLPAEQLADVEQPTPTIRSELPLRFLNILTRDKRLCARWEGDEKGLKDKTRNGFDASLAAMLVQRDFYDDEIALILRRFPHGKAAEKGNKYITELLKKVRPAQDNKAHAPTIEVFSAVELQKMRLPEPRWVVPSLLPEGFSYLVGKPKLGKSWLALALCIAVASGGRALGNLKVPQGDALYLALEDSKRRLQDRMRIICRDGTWPDRLTLAPSGGWPRMHEGGTDHIAEWIQQHTDARLVVIDTLARFRPPRSRNAGIYDDDYMVTAAIQSLAVQHRLGIVAIHHQRKMVAEDKIDTISGSLGLGGAADSVLILERERGQHDAVLFVYGRDVEEQELALKWDEEIMQWTLLGDAKDYRMSATKAAILKELEKANKPLSPKQIAEGLGKTANAVRVALCEMLKAGDVDQPGYGKYSLRGVSSYVQT